MASSETQDAGTNGQDVKANQIYQRTMFAGHYRKLSGSEHWVLSCIDKHANASTGQAWASVGRMAALGGYSERTISRAVSKLESLGLIVTSGRRGGGSTVYRLVPRGDTGVTPCGSTGDTGVTPCEDQGVTLAPKGVTPTSKRGDVGVTLNPLNQENQTAAAASPPKPAAAGGGETGGNSHGNDGYDGTKRTGDNSATAGNDNSQTTTDPAVAERRQALAIAGIGEPTRTELANRSLTPDQIRDAKARQSNVKLLVLDLRGLADQHEALAEDRAEAEAKRRAEEIEAAPKRAAYLEVKAEFEPQSDADRLWHLRFLPRQAHHATEFEFVRTQALWYGRLKDDYDAACAVIVEALVAHPDAAALLSPAEVEATNTPDLRIAREA